MDNEFFVKVANETFRCIATAFLLFSGLIGAGGLLALGLQCYWYGC